MITNNFKNLLAVVLQSMNTSFGCLRIKDVSGHTWYTANEFVFPSARSGGLTRNAVNPGISIGTGDAAATEEDYNLKSTITGGDVALTLSETCLGCDTPGNPYILFKITVTNNGASELTVREIGYKQTFKCVSAPRAAITSEKVFLLDRTVLETPLVLQPSDAGVIYYKLRTDAATTRTKDGVTLVSWEWGTDEQIAAMLDAAQEGTIDLQSDGLWRIGDVRMVDIGAFSGGGVSHGDAQTVGLVISSFEEYEGCGNVMQFDCFTVISGVNFRMNATNTSAGGYGESEMKTVTLPALVEALPSWLKSRLRTFSVKAAAGNNSPTIQTVTDNKLALRSEVEVKNTTSQSKIGEGSLVALYKDNAYCDKGSSNAYWWLRSPWGTDFFAVASKTNSSAQYASGSACLAPFGCL